MRWSEQADDLVMMFTDAARQQRLRLAFDGRRAAILAVADSFTVCPADGPPVPL
jgi:hypothetical protein